MDSRPNITVPDAPTGTSPRTWRSIQDLPAEEESITGYLFGLDRIERVAIPRDAVGRWIAEQFGGPAAVRFPVTSDVSIWVGADSVVGGHPNQLASALEEELLESAVSGEYPVQGEEKERIMGMLTEPGPRPPVHGPCLFVGAGRSGEVVSLPPAFEAWWESLKETWIRRSATTIRMLVGLPPEGELMIGWHSDESDEELSTPPLNSVLLNGKRWGRFRPAHPAIRTPKPTADR